MAMAKFWRVLLLLPMLLPFATDNSYYLNGILNQILIFTILIISLDLIVGYVGDVSLGHAGLFAIGAYAVAILTATPELNSSTEASMQYFPQLPFWLAVLIGVALASLAGFLLAFPSLRLSGDYLAVTTLAYGLIIYTLIIEAEGLTNGVKGIHLPGLGNGQISFEGNEFLWVVYPSLLLAIWLVSNLTRSHWGRAFDAIRTSGLVAESLGVHRSRCKIIGFVISAGLAGFAGGLYAQLNNYVGSNAFSLDLSIFAVIVLIFGGLRSRLGNFLGMSLFILLPETLTVLKDYQHLVFGLILLATFFFFPSGMAGIWEIVRMRLFSGAQQKAKALQELMVLASLSQEKPLAAMTRSSSQEAILSFDNISMQFGGVLAIKDLNFQIRTGEIHGLMGPNGSGKSTVMNLISGVYRPTTGRILFKGKDISSMKAHMRSQEGIARSFQTIHLFPDLTVLENVQVGLHTDYKSSLAEILLRLPSSNKEEMQKRARAMQILKLLGLEELALYPAKMLRQFDARKLEIARALATRPGLLLLDEPAAGLGQQEIRELNELILDLRLSGITILLIEHHMDMLMRLCDQITVINFGQLIAQGTPLEVQNNPLVSAAYLGSEAKVSA